MKTSEQIKGAIRNISKKTGINPNSLLQMCLFEGILEKLSKSKYSENFILKGGLLISSLIGVDMRSTMDMDTTLRGIPLNEVSITKILNEINYDAMAVGNHEFDFGLDEAKKYKDEFGRGTTLPLMIENGK